MLFDAADYGMVEVDRIIQKEDRVIGIVNPYDVYHQITYVRRKGGCSRICSEIAPYADMTPEGREKQDRKIIDVGMSIAMKLR